MCRGFIFHFCYLQQSSGCLCIKSLRALVHVSVGQIPKRGIALLSIMCFFYSFNPFHHVIFQKDCNNLHSHQLHDRTCFLIICQHLMLLLLSLPRLKKKQKKKTCQHFILFHFVLINYFFGHLSILICFSPDACVMFFLFKLDLPLPFCRCLFTSILLFPVALLAMLIYLKATLQQSFVVKCVTDVVS